MKILLIPVTGRNGFRKDFHVSNSFWVFFFLFFWIFFSLLAQMHQDSLLKKEFGVQHSVIHPSTRICRYVFLVSSECHGSECHGVSLRALCSHQKQVSHTKPVWRDLKKKKKIKKILKACYCPKSESEWSRLPHFSAWPAMATLRLSFLLLCLAD